MKALRRQRLVFVFVVIAGVSAAAALAFFAMGENMLYFFSPTQVKAGEVPANRQIRVGGLVVEGSIRRDEGSLTVEFDLTDNLQVITVHFDGILPDLFREGQGIVAIGQLNSTGIFDADEVLAKHDENYMPPEVADALKAAQDGTVVPFPHSGE